MTKKSTIGDGRRTDMTLYTEVVSKVKRMSQAEKLALLRVLADSLNQDAPKSKRKQTLKSLYGALRPKDGHIPTDDELKQDYINYLVEKYQ
jgi:hypothetical protein